MGEIDKRFMVERQGKWFVLYAGLLDAAHGQGLHSIKTQLIQVPSSDNDLTAICYAEVTLLDHATLESEEDELKTFTGIGDANPTNVARIMTPHIIRMAETRAKARALRDAINVGVAALEELAEEESSPVREHASTRPPIDISKNAPPPEHFQSDAPGQRPSGSLPPPSGGLATPNQVRAIYGMARDELALHEQQVDEAAVVMYGSPPSELTKRQASDFINQIKTHQIAVGQPARQISDSTEAPTDDPAYQTWSRNIQNAKNQQAIAAAMEQVDRQHASLKISDACYNALGKLAARREQEVAG